MMLSLFVYFCFGSLFCGYVSGYAANNYALHFPNKGVTNYANIWGMRSLSRFTACFWMKSSASSPGAPFSYNIKTGDNELLIYNNYRGFHLWIGFKYRRIYGSANDGKWHHICVSWRNSDGAFQFYKDGTLQLHGTGLARGHTIRARGSLVLGQEQDSAGGGFSSSQSFQGSLTNVNVWSYVLSASSIKSLSKSCLSGAGNVYMWSDFIRGVKGNTAVFIPSHCHPLSYWG